METINQVKLEGATTDTIQTTNESEKEINTMDKNIEMNAQETETVSLAQSAENSQGINQESPKTNSVPTREENQDRDLGAPVKLGAFIDDGNDLVKADLPKDTYQRDLKALGAAVKNGHVLYGTIYSVEPSEAVGLVINIKYGNIRVMIPAADFFAFTEFKDMDTTSPEEVLVRYRRKAVHTLGGVVSFVPMAVKKDSNGIPFAVASRKKAMQTLQHKYFLSNRAPAKVGAIAKASVISAGPRYITVECLGVESVIGSGDLSAFEYIEDAAEIFKPGDGLHVAIKSLNVDRSTGKVDVVFSHSLIERSNGTVEPVSPRMIGGRYSAKVVAVLEKFIIVIISQMKVRGIVSITPKHYEGDTVPTKGDDVIFLVTGVDEKKNVAIGRCIIV